MNITRCVKLKVDLINCMLESELAELLDEISKVINRILGSDRENSFTFDISRSTQEVSISVVTGIKVTMSQDVTDEEKIKINQHLDGAEIIKAEVLLLEQLVETGPMTAFGTSYGNSGFNDICTKIAQTFVAEGDGQVNKITYKFAQNGCTGNLVISIQSVDINGHPTGIILDSVTLSNSEIPLEGTESMFEILMNQTATLLEGQKYAIVFDPSGLDYGIDKYLYFYESVGTANLTGGEYLGFYNGNWLNWYALQETGLTQLSEITANNVADMVFQVKANLQGVV